MENAPSAKMQSISLLLAIPHQLFTTSNGEVSREVTALSDIEGVEVSAAQEWELLEMAKVYKDMIYYHKKDIVRLISPPIAAGHRGQFIFSDS